MTPATILKNLCHLYHLETPVYTETSVRIGAKLFRVDESMCRSDQFENNQVLALAALGRWKEMPIVGFSLVPEHVETRSLFHPSKPGIEQGKIQMWIDLLQYKEDRPLPEAVDITPRKPKAYELRVIIWNTQDVKLTEDDFFTGEKKSDIYVKGWLSGAEDAQCTDVHYRSLTGEGNFNWRFIFPFEYLSTENQMVFKKKAMIYSRVETEFKTPCRLTLQVWDNDTLLPDDFLGTMTLELANLPKGSPSPHKCNLSIFDPMARTVNLFKIKRTKGWWPFYDRDEKTRENFLTGKVEAELEIFLLDDAIAQPAGMGRDEPQSLPPPKYVM
ncbi:unnamed protein product [Brassicogethes aeneus]|uniref:C2 domain-containing protein n=1 Tax=Brassicogethes aeneus TaxID=1431903 RepID=A0A9P0AR32_BRAAE|nr:unnamed protein product [Brassicogethes aeneus]